jgi:hypothetical protein
LCTHVEFARLVAEAPIDSGLASSPTTRELDLTGNLTLAFGIVLCLVAIAGLLRGLSPPGPRRNTFSVILVVLGLIAMFLFCFGLGAFVRKEKAEAKVSATMPAPPRAGLRA